MHSSHSIVYPKQFLWISYHIHTLRAILTQRVVHALVRWFQNGLPNNLCVIHIIYTILRKYFHIQFVRRDPSQSVAYPTHILWISYHIHTLRIVLTQRVVHAMVRWFQNGLPNNWYVIHIIDTILRKYFHILLVWCTLPTLLYILKIFCEFPITYIHWGPSLHKEMFML
jgi:hypothetical protein